MTARADPWLNLGVDIGGTFTDFAIADGGTLRIYKVPSTPEDPALSVVQGLKELGLPVPHRLVHGSTVATNAVLERRGARAALLTTAGFRDVLEIARQTRPQLYALAPRKPPPLIPRALCFEVAERMDRDGRALVPLSEAGLTCALRAARRAGAESLAVCFLFSFANPAHEHRAGERAEALGFHVSLSSEILPEYREYERASTTAANAYVAPVVARYLERLETALAARGLPGERLRIMQSNGGVLSVAAARRQAVRTILSGPAGGVMGAWHVARLAGRDRVLSFDMGGTSTDVSLLEGRPTTTGEGEIDGLPIRVPMLEIHTVGAGGSLAWRDAGGALRVGPQSAGADPGPAAYGKSDRPTVTDANLVLGRLHPPSYLGGRMKIDPERSRAALATLAEAIGLSVEEAAAGVVRIANIQMARALRRVSVERGHDIRQFTLVAFGGGGPVHACQLAEETGMSEVLVPRYPGALSAIGMLLCDVEREYSRTVMRPTDRLAPGALAEAFAQLEAAAHADLAAEGVPPVDRVLVRWVDMRFRGQSYELGVEAGEADPAAWAQRFHARHRQSFGYADPNEPTEVVNVRLRATGRIPRPRLPAGALRRRPEPRPCGVQPIYWDDWRLCPLYDRAMLAPGQALSGPALVLQEDTTTCLPPDGGRRWTRATIYY
ncbi:MAG: hydantoinase/oxoprolinase family protein [Armatimonadetes bacterium]|nr:hydantoinase/oxoprolinase family protein [Armatimonadota bacterium]